MIRALGFSFFNALVFSLVACGGGHNPDLTSPEEAGTARLGQRAVETVSGASTLIFDNNEISGSGEVRLAEPLPRHDIAANFRFRFRLAEGGSLTLVTNSRRDLSGGVEIEFSRVTGEDGLRVIARTPLDELPLSESFATIDADAEITLAVDIHNDHGETPELIVWNEADGAFLVEDSLRGQGAGPWWGFRLNQAELHEASDHPARDQH